MFKQIGTSRYWVDETGWLQSRWKHRTTTLKSRRILGKSVRQHVKELHGVLLPYDARLTAAAVDDIRTSQHAVAVLAQKYRVSIGYIYKIRRGERR